MSKRTYTRDEVLSSSLEYFNGDEIAADVWRKKYALTDNEGNICELNPDDMHRRLAKEFARIEAKYPNPLSEDEIYSLLAKKDPNRNGMGMICPQGSPMSAIGNPYSVQSLSNCFVVDSPVDSYSGIMRTDEEQVQIMKRRGGVGFDMSTLRPKGMPTRNAAITTDGIAVFMERYSRSCREVAQGGRRGALMQTIDCRHPEVETFVNVKRDRTKVTGANVSVKLTDDFMRAVESSSDFQLRWPIDSDDAKMTKVVSAKAIWEQIIDAAWDSAEPGVLFWDTSKKMSPADVYVPSISTNPCSEIVLSAYDSCRLMVIDLTHFVINPFTANAEFDYDHFGEVTQKAQRLMDDLVDLELEAVDRIIQKIERDDVDEDLKRTELNLWKKVKKAGAAGRRTGLGVTGVGDALAMLNVRYGSDESIGIVDRIYCRLALDAYESSIRLAEQRGAFELFDHDKEKDHPFISRIIGKLSQHIQEKYRKHGRRNIALTTTAPVGSVSVLTQTTSGIEPAFLLEYTRRRKLNPNDVEAKVDFVDKSGDKWQAYKVRHHGFQKWCDVTRQSDVEKSPYWKSTSADVDWLQSIKLQAAAQKWLCHSISKTVNLPKDASHELVANVYMTAWKLGCKGCTIYRDGSRDGVLVVDNEAKFDLNARLTGVPHDELKKTIEVGRKYSDVMPQAHLKYLDDVERWLVEPKDQSSVVAFQTALKRPKELPCEVHRVTAEGKPWLVLVGMNDDKPYEVFCGLSEHVEIPKKAKIGTIVKNGKKDGVATYNLAIPVGDDDRIVFHDIVELFKNDTYSAFTRTISLSLRHGIPIQFIVEQLQKSTSNDLFSFSKVLARVLKKYIVDGTRVTLQKTCDECGSTKLVYIEGCMQCSECGFGKCS